MFKSMLARKIIFLGFSIIVVLAALWLIEELIQERLSYKNYAKESIANSWSGSQLLVGPIFVIPYTYIGVETYRNATDNKLYERDVERSGQYYLIPEKLQYDADLTTQSRSKGIFTFPVYTSEIKVTGEFDLLNMKNILKDVNLIGIGTPYLSVSLSDARGINNTPVLTWDGREYDFEAGSKVGFNSEGLHVVLHNLNSAKYKFSFEISLRGMGTLWFTPMAKDTKVNLDATWEHPNFIGSFLPIKHNIEADRFQANWSIPEFSSSVTNVSEHTLSEKQFGVSLNTPVDIYRLSIRSVKYGILFVGLTFISFFVFEILKKLKIHPVQYTLVALSLSVFYLLLIAFSEALGFMLAYLLATISCVSLLTFYIYSILHDLKWGLIFGGFVAALYAMLYIILQSQSHALLLGSTLVFIMLALVMVMTRHLDWYKVGENIGKKENNMD